MVNTLRSPVYDLDLIRSAVKGGAWTMTRRAIQTAEDLGYTPDDVEKVLLSLTTEDFWHVWINRDDQTKRPRLDSNGQEIRWDVYGPEITAPNGEKCQVYLKLSFDEHGNAQVVVRSFHLPWK